MKSLKHLIILAFLSVFSAVLKAQNYNPIINYSFNDTPVNGIKIKTNIPFVNQQGMPTIIIEGYNYFDAEPIGLIFNWYIYEDQFINNNISSSGAYTPEIKLSNENGKVVIFINDKKYFNRFTIRGFAHGISETASWFSDWNIVDEPLNGTQTVSLSYKNAVGELNFPRGMISNDGNVGIGTSSPVSRLEVYNQASKSHLTLSADDNNANDMSRIDLDYKIKNKNHIVGRISSFYWDSGNGGTGGLRFYTRNAGELTEKMRIAPNGNVSVNNKLEAREIKVTTSPTADFVFEDHYKLPDLESVEKHIREKKHLPEIASAAEMQKDGVNIGDFQIKLLQKIEELTLYSIEQNKQNKQQQERILKLEEEVKALNRR